MANCNLADSIEQKRVKLSWIPHNEPLGPPGGEDAAETSLWWSGAQSRPVHSFTESCVSPLARSCCGAYIGQQPQLLVNKDARKFYLRTNITAAMCTKPSTIGLCAVFLMHLGKRREFSCLPLYTPRREVRNTRSLVLLPRTDLSTVLFCLAPRPSYRVSRVYTLFSWWLITRRT